MIPASQLRKWEDRGWEFDKEIGDTAFQIKKKYSAWEQFEMRTRQLFKLIGFQDVIDDPENFHYTEAENSNGALIASINSAE